MLLNYYELAQFNTLKQQTPSLFCLEKVYLQCGVILELRDVASHR